MRRMGSNVGGGGPRSARHHRRTKRKRPRGVAPSPSRLLALMPDRPSATGMFAAPTTSQPWLRFPGRGRTKMLATDMLRIVGYNWRSKPCWLEPVGSVCTSFASDRTVNYRMHALPISDHSSVPACPCSAKAALGAVDRPSMLARVAFANLSFPGRAGDGCCA